MYEYYSGKGFEYENNQVVFNFKKPPNSKGQCYKDKAIRHFADLLTNTRWPPDSAITAAATSKPSSSKDYDDRLDRVLRLFSQSASIPVLKCFDALHSTVPAHQSTCFRTPDIAALNIQLLKFSLPENTKTLFILDDVITTGSSFIAMKNMVKEKFPTLNVCGIFLAKANRIKE